MLQTAAHGQRYQGALAEILPGKGRKGSRETWIYPSLRSNIHTYRLAWRKHTLFDRRPLAARQYLSALDPLEKTVARINEYKPDVIHAFGSYIEELFAHLEATGRTLYGARVAGFGGTGSRTSPGA